VRAVNPNGRRIGWGPVLAVCLSLLAAGKGMAATPAAASAGFAVEESRGAASTPFAIDLPTVLRLAGAENLEVRIARERVKEAQALHEQTRLQYFPWLAPGFGYRAHDGNLQDVGGTVLEVEKQSYTAGVALNAQLNLGDAIYQSLAARQRARAAEEYQEVRRQEAVYRAAVGYFELSRAVGAVGAAADAVRIAEDYARQVRQAVDAGIAFQGDSFRTEVQWQRNRTLQRQAEEQRRVAAARLAETLRLEPETDLALAEPDCAPLSPGHTNANLGSLVARALTARPELRQSASWAASAEADRKGAVRGPWIPTVGAQAYFGGLGGGADDHLGSLGDTEDYFLGLGWRLGPGGLFDRGRVRAAESRQRASTLEVERVRLEIQRQVVEALTRCQSLADQLLSMERSVVAATQLLELSRARREFGVGAVLETIQAEQELTRARLDYLQVVSEHNKAQFALKRAVGE
jgi:outer membrane protein TolC